MPGKHESIISQELFEKVAKVRAQRGRSGRQYVPKYRVYLLGGLLKCEECGQKLKDKTD